MVYVQPDHMKLLLVGQGCIVLSEPNPEIPLFLGISHGAAELFQVEVQLIRTACLEVAVQQ